MTDHPPCIETALSQRDLEINELRSIIAYFNYKNISKEVELILKGVFKEKYEEAKQLTLENTRFKCSDLSRFCDGNCNLSDFHRIINEVEECILLKKSGVLIVKIRGETWSIELEKLFTDSGNVTMRDFIIWYTKTFGRTIQLLKVRRKNEQIDQHKELLDFFLSIADQVDDISDIEHVAGEVLNRICTTYAEKFDGNEVYDVMYQGNDLYVSSRFIQFELKRLKTSVGIKSLAGYYSSKGLREKKTRIITVSGNSHRYWVFKINALRRFGYEPLLSSDESDVDYLYDEGSGYIEEEADR